jgi:hypothetical protein
MVVHPGGRMQVFAVPAILVNAIDAIDFNFARLNVSTCGLNKFEIFVFVIPTHRGGKQQNGITPISEFQHLDFSSQAIRPEFVVRLLQGFSFNGLLKSQNIYICLRLK